MNDKNELMIPEDFMFQMSKEEMADWKSQIVISNSEKMGFRKPPLVFTEQGFHFALPGEDVFHSTRAAKHQSKIFERIGKYSPGFC